MRPTRASLRPRWIVLFIVLSVVLLGLLGDMVHKNARAFAGGGQAQAQQQAASEQEEESEPEAAGQGGFYMNPFWLALVVISVAGWLFACSWVYDDALGVGVAPERWTSIMVGTGAVTVAAMLLIHAALGFLVIAAVIGAFSAYVAERNKEVPKLHRLFGPEHRERMFGKLKFWGGGERERVTTAGFTLMRQDSQTLEHLVMDREEMEEAASVTSELVTRAIQVRGRSIRILPTDGSLSAGLDLDGVMQNLETLEPDLGNGVLRCLSWLWSGRPGGEEEEEYEDEASRRMFYAEVPGEGKLEIEGRPVKTKRGSGVELTLPDWTKQLYKDGLGACGMSKGMIKKVEEALQQGNGAVLASGPPGSGTTTTLYALVKHIDIFTTEVLSIEDNVEHELEQVLRRELNPEEGLDFDKTLELALREEPDIIMYGELEEPGPATELFKFAAKQGALISTMKANRSTGAVARLAEELQVRKDLLGATLKCVINQRLIRKLCDTCKEPFEPPPGLLKKMNVNPERPGRWFKPVGCEECFNTGYHGRTALFELLVVDERLSKVLKAAAEKGRALSAQMVKKATGARALRTLQADGLRKVTRGITTLDEVRSCLNP